MSQALIAQLERIRRELSKQPTPENSRRLMRDFQRAVETWRDAGNPKTEEILRTLREITSALETLYVADRTVDVGEFTKDLFQVSGKLVEGVAELVRTGMTAQGSKTTAQIAKQLEEKFKGLQLPRIRQWAYTWARTARGAEAQTRAMGVRADVAPEQQFFRYDGPVTNMRPFCAGKIGQVFSLKEIRAMKSPNGLPVEQYCGGYNCRHRWVRVAGRGTNAAPSVGNGFSDGKGSFADASDFDSTSMSQKEIADMRNALNTFGRVIKLPIDRIEFSKKDLGGSFGRYDPYGEKKAIYMNFEQVNAKYGEKEAQYTMYHELGHYIDNKLYELFADKSKSITKIGPLASENLKQLRASAPVKAFKEIISALQKSDAVDIIKKRYHKDGVDYLASNRELFARAIAQYVEERAGLVSAKHNESIPEGRQWERNEFARIKPMFDKLFEELQWKESK